ncbi:alkyl hydroperoxide reductase subunit D [Nannocystis exedens]|uniref:Alkyl hydroperoxide reductase AhpD n=1 Tax=Nannocystis exedens TaxID=54 RepID=A0A1I1XN00_9BACT|nr:carboxymuconolactone decarboxylase family protein [Nannocystis exedens]PCC73306.1 alkyl hydroperoxide reductase AhpD [Nannocystis exedens]SFE08696.1 alkyl hydroperoxide reductase subunit D [Nannocystis exedens]
MANTVESLREQLPEAARDLKVNLQNVLQESSLTPAQRWGTAVACAIASRNATLTQVLVDAAREQVDAATIEDARAAAALMAMNNVYYRFKHMVGSEDYEKLPARLRMTRIAKPHSSKLDFELFCLAVSAVFGCERCVVSHEKTIREAGGTSEQIHDAVRTGAVVHGVAVALELGV